MAKQTKQQLEKKRDSHKKRVKFYNRKILDLKNESKRIGFRFKNETK